MYVPDGLAFNPEPCLAQLLSHPDLGGPGGTPELDEEIARRVTNAAILWVEQYGAPLADLRRLEADFERWRSANRHEGKELAMVTVRYLDAHPEALRDYEALRNAFPKSLNSYYQQHRGVEPVGVPDRAWEAIQALKRREIADIKALDDVQGYRVQITAAQIAAEGGLADRTAVLCNAGLRKAFEEAEAEIKAALAVRRANSAVDDRHLTNLQKLIPATRTTSKPTTNFGGYPYSSLL